MARLKKHPPSTAPPLIPAHPVTLPPPPPAAVAPPRLPDFPRTDSQAPLLPPHQRESAREREREAHRLTELPPIRYLRAWTYPLKGIYYLLRHPVLFRPIRQRLPLALLLSSIILALMFLLTYLPQVALIALFRIHGPLAFVHAALAVLSESAVLISFVLENFVLEEQMVDVFDAVLLLKGLDGVVERGRVVFPPDPSDDRPSTVSPPAPTSDPYPAEDPRSPTGTEGGAGAKAKGDVVRRLGPFRQSPFVRFSCGLLVEWALELPVNFVPVVGPALFIVLQGYRAGPMQHYHYVQLLGLKKKEQREYFRHHRWEYLGFGSVGLVLQTFPILSTFVCFSNAVGAALWAARVERAKAARALAQDQGDEGDA